MTGFFPPTTVLTLHQPGHERFEFSQLLETHRVGHNGFGGDVTMQWPGFCSGRNYDDPCNAKSMLQLKNGLTKERSLLATYYLLRKMELELLST